jgi:apolipoprotein N-acyltransferase
MIVGVLKQNVHNRSDYFNSLIVTGLGSGEYYKHHLVPFGEYIPYKKLLTPLLKKLGAPLSSIVPSRSKQLVTIPDLKIVPAICYEITFTDFIRQAIYKYDAHLIVNISEDGWFGDSLGPHQHLEIARMRALENGAYVIRSTPTGLSAIIDYRGKIVVQAKQFTRTVITGEVYELSGHTPWSKIGQWPILLIMLISLLVLIVLMILQKPHNMLN